MARLRMHESRRIRRVLVRMRSSRAAYREWRERSSPGSKRNCTDEHLAPKQTYSQNQLNNKKHNNDNINTTMKHNILTNRHLPLSGVWGPPPPTQPPVCVPHLPCQKRTSEGMGRQGVVLKHRIPSITSFLVVFV